MTLAILFSLKTMKSFQIGVATHFQVPPLFSMRTESLGLSLSCRSIDADAWRKQALISLALRAYSHGMKSNNIKEKHRRKLSLSFLLSLGVNGPQIKSYIAASNEHVRSFNRLHSSSSRVLRKINFLNESCDNLILVSLPYLCSMSPTLSIYHII